MGRKVKCPSEFSQQKYREISIFLGGGITGCDDWQRVVEDLLTENNDRIVTINPRRDNFDITNPKMSEEQIEWEHKHLRLSDVILFWFPPETLCPITLFEYGFWLGQKTKPIFVGTDPQYKRRFDVIIQTQLVSDHITVHGNLMDLIRDVKRYSLIVS